MDAEFKRYIEELAAELARDKRVESIKTDVRKECAAIFCETDTVKVNAVIGFDWRVSMWAVDIDDSAKMTKWCLEDSHPKIVRLMMSHMIDHIEDMQYWFDG